MTKKLLCLFLALAVIVSLSACAGAPVSSSGDSGNVRTYTDDCGREVVIPAEIRRIVPSGPLAQIVLFSLAPEMLVGLSSEWDDCAKDYIAEEYFGLQVFGTLYGSADLNVEELALAAPDLIIDIGEAKKSVVGDMDDLQAKTTVPSVHIEATLATMPQAYRALGALLGKEEKAEELASFCERTYARTLGIMDSVGESRVSALYILGEDGLNVLAKGSYHAEVIDMLTDNAAVVENPAGRGTGNEVSFEQIAAWDPEFILFAPGSVCSVAAEKDGWRELGAVSSRNYAEVPEGPHNWMGNPPSVQRYLSLIWLTAVLYPEYCDYDVKSEVTEYYRLFYGCELTDAQYGVLTANAFPGF